MKRAYQIANLLRRQQSLRKLCFEEVDFYFYFKQKDNALKVKDILENEGFEVVDFDISWYGNGERWCLIVTKKIREDELFPICQRFDLYAKKFNGEYDGYEREM